jgi:hypothetical protein
MIEEASLIADDGENDTYLDEQGKVRIDHDVIQRSKLRVEQRRWHAGRLNPKKYGDKVQIEDVTPIRPEDARQELAAFLAGLVAGATK